MSARDDGGPAFPGMDTHYPDGSVQFGPIGMSLRDYFAAAALTGLMARPDLPVYKGEVVTAAFVYADAMLAERTK